MLIYFMVIVAGVLCSRIEPLNSKAATLMDRSRAKDLSARRCCVLRPNGFVAVWRDASGVPRYAGQE